LLLGACSSTFQPAHLDPTTGRFAGDARVDTVETQAPFDARYSKMLYVMTDSKIDSFNDFFIQSFTSMGSFTTVIGKDKIEALVIQKNLTDKVPSVSDLVGLNRLAKEIGPFLVVEPTVVFLGGYRFQASLKVTDASTGGVVLKITNAATNWAGLDKPLFYPLFNAFLDWTKGRPILTGPATATH
jgi:hypothetical protein